MKYTNKGLVDHARKALSEKWCYVYGTIGLLLTDAIIKQKQAQYPEQINKYLNLIKTYIGRRSVDCVNLIKSYLWWDDSKNGPVYSIKFDKVNGVWMCANGMYQIAKEKGPLNTIPEIPGICVWRNGHIGIYIGSGQVIEAKGTKYGVVQTPLKGTGSNSWTQWLKCPLIEYDDEFTEYKLIIQERCGFGNPQGVWEVIEKYHPYPEALYQQWADSYTKMPG